MDIIFASAKLSNISAELAKSRLYRRIKKLGHFSCFSGQNSLRIRCPSLFLSEKQLFSELLVLFWVRKAYSWRILIWKTDEVN
jgi:hypothetical protein